MEEKEILAFGDSLTAGWFVAVAHFEDLWHPYAKRLTALLRQSSTPNYKVDSSIDVLNIKYFIP